MEFIFFYISHRVLVLTRTGFHLQEASAADGEDAAGGEGDNAGGDGDAGGGDGDAGATTEAEAAAVHSGCKCVIC